MKDRQEIEIRRQRELEKTVEVSNRVGGRGVAVLRYCGVAPWAASE